MDKVAAQGTALETVIIFTPRMEELAAFYQQGLGLEDYDRSPAHMGQQLGPVYFGFDQVAEAAEQGPSGITIWFTVDDLQAVFERLVVKGAEVRYGPTRKPWGALLASVRDPDGNIIGIAQRRP